MNKTFLIILFTFFLLNIHAQNSIPEYVSADSIMVDDVEIDVQPIPVTEEDTLSLKLPDFAPWEVVKMEGKLKMSGLPLSPSLKIFMKKDSLIDISIRAPFVGEAAHAVITPDTVTIVNKMNKTYVKEGISYFLQYYPGGISDFQNLFLARVFLPGHDIMNENIIELVDVLYDNQQFNIIPKGEAEIPGFIYGYVIDNLFNPLWLVIIPESRPDIEVDFQYVYKLKGYDINVSLAQNGKKRDLTLELKEPQWQGEIPEPIELNKKFRQLSFSEFMTSF